MCRILGVISVENKVGIASYVYGDTCLPSTHMYLPILAFRRFHLLRKCMPTYEHSFCAAAMAIKYTTASTNHDF